jgi:hypothetical protein
MQQDKNEIQRLSYYEEAIGSLSELTIDHGFLIARIGKVNLVLPHEVEGKLCPLVGTRIGILHTDIPGKEYLIRSTPDEKSSASDEIDKIDLPMGNAQKVKASA